MAMTNQQMLELVEQAIQNRLAGDGVNSYSDTTGNRFEGESLDKLFERRERLIAAINASSGGARLLKVMGA